MINFRFHLVSLIAVFLALAVGVVMGYGVLGQPTVDTLQRRVDTVEASANATRAENAELRAEQKRLEETMQGAAAFAVTDRLANTTVLPVMVAGADEDQVADTVRLARNADGTVPGAILLEEKWNLEGDGDAEELASVIGFSSTTKTAIRDAGLKALATRLAGGTGTGSVAPGRGDLLGALRDAGFISVKEVDGQPFDPTTYNGRGATTLLVGQTQSKLDWPRTLVPLARTIVGDGGTVITADDYRAVDGGPQRGDLLAVIRSDPTLKTQVASIDDLDVVDGPLTAVLVIAERKRGTVAHYGFGRGADEAMPAWAG